MGGSSWHEDFLHERYRRITNGNKTETGRVFPPFSICIRVYMYPIMQFTICLQFVHNLFTICSYGVHIYMLYCIIEGREPGLIWWVESNSTESLEKIYMEAKKFHVARKKF